MSVDGKEKSRSYQARLRLEFESKKKENPRLTLRSFARTLDIAPSTLLDVMSGKRHFRWVTAAKVGARLKWSREHVQSMIEQIASTKRSRVPESMPTVMEAFLNSSEFDKLAEWPLMAILALARTENNSAEPSTIAKKLGITASQARAAVEFLKETNYLQVTHGKMRVTKPAGPFTIRYPTVKVIQYQKTLLKMAGDALAKHPPRTRLSLIRMIPIDADQLTALESILWKSYVQLEKKARTMRQKDVYCLAIQFFPISKR